MFSVWKKLDPTAIYAFCDGTLVLLEDVQDEIFSKKMMGDGCAILPSNDEIIAPFDGVVTMIFPTKHAIGLRRNDGLELLIHIGMDTVNEQGKGFTSYVQANDQIRCGSPLIHFEREDLISKGYDITIPCIITNEPYPIVEITKEKDITKKKTVLIKTGKN